MPWVMRQQFGEINTLQRCLWPQRGPVKTEKQLRDGRTDPQGQKGVGDPSRTDGETEAQRGQGLNQDPQPDPLPPRPFPASSLVCIAENSKVSQQTDRASHLGLDGGGRERIWDLNTSKFHVFPGEG